jgi:hypothetical protein
LASPVHGGRLASPIAAFFEKAPSLKGKKVVCVGTHFLSYEMGGRQMLELMQAACQQKGAHVVGTANVFRLSLRQKKYINAIVALLEKAI